MAQYTPNNIFQFAAASYTPSNVFQQLDEAAQGQVVGVTDAALSFSAQLLPQGVVELSTDVSVFSSISTVAVVGSIFGGNPSFEDTTSLKFTFESKQYTPSYVFQPSTIISTRFIGELDNTDDAQAAIVAYTNPSGDVSFNTGDAVSFIEALTPYEAVFNATTEDSTANVDALRSVEAVLDSTTNTTLAAVGETPYIATVEAFTADSTANIEGINPTLATLGVTTEEVASAIIGSYPTNAVLTDTTEAALSFTSNVSYHSLLIANTENVTVDVVGLIAGEGVLTVTTDNADTDIVGNQYAVGDLEIVTSVIVDVIGNRKDYTAIIGATTDNPTAEIDGEYDANIPRTINASFCQADSNAKQLTVSVCDTVFNGVVEIGKINVDIEEAEKIISRHCLNVDTTQQQFNKVGINQEEAAPTMAALCSIVENATQVHTDRKLNQEEAGSTIFSRCLDRENATPVENDFNIDYESVDNKIVEHFDRRHVVKGRGYTPKNKFIMNGRDDDLSLFTFDKHELIYFNVGTSRGAVNAGFCAATEQAYNLDKMICNDYQEARKPPNGRSIIPDAPIVKPIITPPSGNQSLIIPIRDSYTVNNIISSTTDDGLTTIELSNVNINLDADSHSWNFNASLLEYAQRDLLRPNGDGSAVIIRITINGEMWRFLVEEITINRVFEKNTIGISGRGITALLTNPYKKPISQSFGSDLTNQQIAEQIIPLDWSIVWNMPTWLVNGGAFSYSDKTIMEALKGIADDIGAVIIPHNSDKTITFSPRYPVYPWNFGATSADFVIPDSVIRSLVEKPSTTYQPNAVYVHGEEIGGELSLVRFNGTAGDRLAPTVENSLMTDVIATRSLGEKILSDEYEQPIYKSLVTFMDAQTVPFIPIGSLIEVIVGVESVKGIVNSVSITANLPTVTMTLTIGRSTSNVFTSFVELLPEDIIKVATVSSTTGTSSLVTLIDGGVETVKGLGVVGTNVYIKGGEIVSKAPTLPTSTVIV